MPNPTQTGLTDSIIAIVPLPSAEPLTLLRASGGDLQVKLRGPRAIVNQSEVQCCVSCALAACLESLHPEYPRLSALFHYAMTVAPQSGSAVNPDRGMSTVEGLATMYRRGISSFEAHHWPFAKPEAATRPTEAAIQEALGRVVVELDLRTYRRFFQPIGLLVDPVNECKKHLQEGRPLLFGIHLTANRGAVKLTHPGNRTGAAHAVACLGYSDLEASLIIQDSFGPDYGSGGQWWLPYQTFVSAEPVVFSAYAIGYNLKEKST